MTRSMRRNGALDCIGSAALLAVVWFCTGCSSIPGVTGASSIRVEVDVYKGALLKQWQTQWAELMAIIFEGQATIEFLTNEAVISARRFDCDITDGRSKSSVLSNPEIYVELAVKAKHEKEFEDGEHERCHTVAAVLADLQALTREIDQQFRTGGATLDVGNRAELTKKLSDTLSEANRVGDRIEILLRVVQVAKRLKHKGQSWAQYQAATFPKERRTRILIANVGAYLNELGNQLGSRADALLMMENEQIWNAWNQSIVYSLRDASTTDFLNLYDWNDAMTSRFGRKPADRVRLLEHLVNDENWENVNTVFAAGQGEFTAALVKDDIGNWNLKSYDNDPREMLMAYRKVGEAALKTAAKAAASGAGGPGAAQAASQATQLALQLANDANLGGGADSASWSIEVTQLHAGVIDSLNQIAAKREATWTYLVTREAVAAEEVVQAETLFEKRQAELDEATKERTLAGGAVDEALASAKSANERNSEWSVSGTEDALARLEEARQLLESAGRVVEERRVAWAEARQALLVAQVKYEHVQREKLRFPHEIRAEISALFQLQQSLLDDLDAGIGS